MALDRWIGLILLGFCLVYGYTAWFTMDGGLAPFMKRNPIWPSTFPKLLSVLGIITSMTIVLGLEKSTPKELDVDYRRLLDYNLGQALLLLALMVVYALVLRPFGFLGSTIAFLAIGSFILGERRPVRMVLVSLIAAYIVWLLVHIVLGIFLLPLPVIFPDLNAGFITLNEVLVNNIAVGFHKIGRVFSITGGSN